MMPSWGPANTNMSTVSYQDHLQSIHIELEAYQGSTDYIKYVGRVDIPTDDEIHIMSAQCCCHLECLHLNLNWKFQGRTGFSVEQLREAR